MHTLRSLFCLAATLLTGCNAPAPKPGKGPEGDADVRQAFAALQTAVKERNGEKIYELLSSDSRQDADRVAKAIKDSYAVADPKKKDELTKKIGLGSDKLQELSGKSFLASDLFIHYDEHNEIPDVKDLDKVDVKANTAKVQYKDPDNPVNMTKIDLVREDNRWRFQLGMPKPPE